MLYEVITLERLREFQNIEKPASERRSAEELDWAVRRISDVWEVITDEAARDGIAKIIDEIRTKPNEDWPIVEIRAAFWCSYNFV